MRIHHLALRTDDVPRLERFYRALLDFPVLRREENVWLDAGGTILMLERRGAAEPPIPAGALELTCFSIAADEGPALRARLAAAAIPIEDRTRFTLYVRDPDGRRVGLSSYPEALSES